MFNIDKIIFDVGDAFDTFETQMERIAEDYADIANFEMNGDLPEEVVIAIEEMRKIAYDKCHTAISQAYDELVEGIRFDPSHYKLD